MEAVAGSEMPFAPGQLVLPVISKQNIPKMYVLMDGVQVPVVAAETEGRASRIEGLSALCAYSPHSGI
jgi:hypothetical protein